MAYTAVNAAPFRASMLPAALKRTMTARSAYAAAAPCDRPVTPSMEEPLGEASNWTLNEPLCAANAVFSHEEDVWHDAGGAGAVTVIAPGPATPSLVAVMVAVPPARPVTSPLT